MFLHDNNRNIFNFVGKKIVIKQNIYIYINYILEI